MNYLDDLSDFYDFNGFNDLTIWQIDEFPHRQMIADYWLLDSFLLRLAGYFFWLWFMRLSFFRYCLATVWLRNWRSPEVMSVNWTPTPWLESPSLGWRIIDQITFPATLMVCWREAWWWWRSFLPMAEFLYRRWRHLRYWHCGSLLRSCPGWSAWWQAIESRSWA